MRTCLTMRHTPKYTEARAQEGHKLRVQPNIANILTVPLMLHDPHPSHFNVLTFWHNTKTSHWTVSAVKVCESRNRLLLLGPLLLLCVVHGEEEEAL